MEQTTNVRRDGASGLGAEAAAAVATLACLGHAERRAAIHALGFAEPRRLWTPRDLSALPTLTGCVPGDDRTAIYNTEAWRLGYRRTTTLVAYILQNVGLAALSALLGGVSLAKVGTAKRENIAQRVAQLGKCEYGGWVRGSRRYEHAPGFNRFECAPRLQLSSQHPLSPVRLCAHGIEIDVPEGLSCEEFEARLNHALGFLRLQNIVDSEAGRRLCTETDVAPAQFRRFYKTEDGAYRAATELTLMRPQADVGALARVCEDIVIDRVLGRQPKRPVR